MEKVEAEICFDLFCGHGSFASQLYRQRFATLVCVDRKRDALADVPVGETIHPYQGNNETLVMPLVREWGFPDFTDLDAYGSPDTVLTRLLRKSGGKDRFAVVATDGTFLRRQMANTVPACWGAGYKDLRWAPQSVGLKDWPVLIYRNLEHWLLATGHRVAEFDCYRPQGHQVFYWGALIER